MSDGIRALLWGVAVATVCILLPTDFSPEDPQNAWIRFALRFVAVGSLALISELIRSKCTSSSKMVIAVSAFGIAVGALRSITWVLDAGPHNGEPLPWNNVVLPALDLWMSCVGTVAIVEFVSAPSSWFKRMLWYGVVYSAWNLAEALGAYCSMNIEELRSAPPVVGFLGEAIEKRSPDKLAILLIALLSPAYWAPIVSANVPRIQAPPASK